MKAGTTLHATCVVVGEAGVLIRGPSGTGKSTLARELMGDAADRGRFARLVGDDRVRVRSHNGRLVAAAVATIEGRLEARGLGILATASEPAAVVRLVIDCQSEEPQRLPEPAERVATICGVTLPRIAVRVRPGLSRLILMQLGDLHDTLMTE